MLLLRRAANAVGLRPARAFLPYPLIYTAATTRFFSDTAFRLDAADPKPSTSADPLPSTLWSPWQVSDLKKREIRFYKKYGPNYIDHVDAETQELLRKGIEARKRVEVIVKEELGDENSHLWYEVLRESSKRFRKSMDSVHEKFRRRQKKLGPAIEGQETPEQRQLALEREEHAQADYRSRRREIRKQVVKELLKKS